jgi:Cu2+-exporting ATPase
MATPLSMAVAAGRAARAGLFIKSDEATQRLTEVDTVVLDKTGTLTEGQMTLVDWVGEEAVLDLAAALEAHANHPIAAALVRARGLQDAAGGASVSGDGAPRHAGGRPEVTGQPGLGAGRPLTGAPRPAPVPLDGVPEARCGPVRCVEAEAGQGLRGLVGGQAVAVGRPDWIAAQTARPVPPEFAEAFRRYAAEGHTPVAVLLDGGWAAALAFGDRLRDDAAALVRAFEREGKEVRLLSGDHPDAVAVVARQLGLAPERARGGVTPEGKHAAVEALKDAGRVVLVVGDGVNDAAALQAADVGVAVGGGSTASLVAADVFLTRPGLEPLHRLTEGARGVMRTIRRLLALSLLYNAAGAAAAVAGLVTPLVAAVAMPVSSLLVVALAILQPSFRDASLARRR